MIRVPADLSVDSLIAAYRAGYFPMPVRRRIAWFSPNPRGIFLPGHLRVTKSLARSRSRFEIRVNSAFPEVISACGDPARPMGWINRAIIEFFHRTPPCGPRPQRRSLGRRRFGRRALRRLDRRLLRRRIHVPSSGRCIQGGVGSPRRNDADRSRRRDRYPMDHRSSGFTRRFRPHPR